MDPATAITQQIDQVRDSWFRVGTVTDVSVPGQVTADVAGAELIVPTLNSYSPIVGDSVKIVVWNGQKLALGKPGPYISGGVGGPHGHAQSEVTALVADLAGKAATAHGHGQAEITSLVTDLAGKASTGHSHPADQAAGTASLRTLGTGSVQAAAGDHAHGGGGAGSPIDTAQYTSTGQTIAYNVVVDLAFATVDRAITGITRATHGATGHQWTLAEAGTYTITATIRFLGGSTTGRECYIELIETTAGVLGASSNVQSEPASSTVNLAVTRYFAAGSVIWLAAYNSNPGGMTLDASTPGWNRVNITHVTGAGDHDHPESEITGLTTDLAGKSDTGHTHSYQPVDTDLTTIAGLTPTTNNVIQSVSSAWASRTPTQLLGTLPADQAAGTASPRTLGTGSAQAAAGDHAHGGAYQPLDTDLTTIAGLAATTDNVIQSTGSAWASRTPTQHQATHPADQAAGTASVRTLGTGATQAAAGNDSRLSDQRTPTDGSVTDAKVNSSAAIAESKLSLASDAAAGTASRRSLGTGATQAAAGDHTHAGGGLDADLEAIAALTPANDDIIQRKAGAWVNRTMIQLGADLGVGGGGSPTGPASGSLTGSYPGPTIAAGAVGGTEIAAAIKDPIAATVGLRTLGTGAQQAAAGDHLHAAAYQPLDTDLTAIAGLAATTNNVLQSVSSAWASRTPTQLLATLPADQAAGTASPRTLGTGATQSAAGDHLHAATYQPVDTDLTTIAGLAATTDNVMQSTASAWASRTPTQHQATHPADQAVGTASVRTLGTGATQAAAGDHLHAAAYQPVDTDLTTIAGLTATTNNILQSVSSAWASRTPTQVAATFPADQAAGTASLRTLGTAATTAAAGDHGHAVVVARFQRTTATSSHTGASQATAQKVCQLDVAVISGRAYRIVANVPMFINGSTTFGQMQATLVATTDGSTPLVTSTQLYATTPVLASTGVVGEAIIDTIYVPASSVTLKLLITNHVRLASGGTSWAVYGAASWPMQLTVQDLGVAPAATGTAF